MLDKIIYQILELPFFKSRHEALENNHHFIGSIIPLDIEKVVIELNEFRANFIEEISKADDLSDEDRRYLKRVKVVTYREFLLLFDKYNFDNFHSSNIYGSESYAQDEIRRKANLYDLTDKERERYREKYIKEHRREEQKEHENRAKKSFYEFTNTYTKDITGYTKYLKESDPKIYKLLSNEVNIYIPESERLKHTYITAMTGAGKSEVLKLLINSYIKLNKINSYCSTVLIEPHGDLATEVAQLKSNALSKDLIYINPYLNEHFIPTINPFELVGEKTEQNIDVTTQELVNVFAEILGSNFSVNMEALLYPTIATLLRLNSKDNPIGLETLQRFMNDSHNEDLVSLAVKSPNISHREFFKNGFYNSNLSTSKQALYSKIQSLLNSHIFSKLILGKSTINLEYLLNSRKLIIFNLSKGLLGVEASRAFGRFIVAMINSILLKRVKQKKEERVPIHLFIDEAQNYISSSIETTLTELRKYGLHLTFAQQILGQDSDTQLENIMLSNTNIKISGANSLHTLTKLSNETGTPLENLQSLKTGEFHIKIARRDSFKVNVSDELITDASMSEDEFEYIKRLQLRYYYKPMNENHDIGKIHKRLDDELNELFEKIRAKKTSKSNHEDDLTQNSFFKTVVKAFNFAKDIYMKNREQQSKKNEEPNNGQEKEEFTEEQTTPNQEETQYEEVIQSSEEKEPNAQTTFKTKYPPPPED